MLIHIGIFVCVKLLVEVLSRNTEPYEVGRKEEGARKEARVES